MGLWRTSSRLGAIGATIALLTGPLAVAPATALGSLDTPSGLTVLEILEGGAVASSPAAPGVSGVTLGTLVAGTAGAVAAAVDLTGWPASSATVGDVVAGLAQGVNPLAGWVADPTQTTTPVGEYWTGGGSFFRATVRINYSTAAGGTITISRYYGTGLQGINTSLTTVYSDPMEPMGQSLKHRGYMNGWRTFSAVGGPQATQTQEFPPGISGFQVAGHRWYAPGQPNRPVDGPYGAGNVTRFAECTGAGGVTQLVSSATPLDIARPDSYAMPAVRCPEGMILSRFWSTWTPDGGAPQSLTPPTSTPDWVRAIPQQYPACLAGECLLRLSRHIGSEVEACGELAQQCPDWYIAADRAQAYSCAWGSYEVALHYCSLFRDPGSVLPNSSVNDLGDVVYNEWPVLEADTGPVQRAKARLVARYGNDSCAALGEAVRARLSVVSVTDSTSVCQQTGIITALRFAQGSNADAGLIDIVPPLVGAADGSTLTDFFPDCEMIADDGSCIDGDPEPDPEPEPDPAGGAVEPPRNCLDAVARQSLEDSMPEQGHHMATKYGQFGARFARIFARYGLSINAAWNVRMMPHRGPHPWSYHNWVMSNVTRADAEARLAPESQRQAVFEQLFKQYVTDVVMSDPTIVRVAYWKCNSDYRWR